MKSSNPSRTRWPSALKVRAVRMVPDAIKDHYKATVGPRTVAAE